MVLPLCTPLARALLAFTCKEYYATYKKHIKATSTLRELTASEGDLALFQALLAEFGEPADAAPSLWLAEAARSGNAELLQHLFQLESVAALLQTAAEDLEGEMKATFGLERIAADLGAPGSRATASTATTFVALFAWEYELPTAHMLGVHGPRHPLLRRERQVGGVSSIQERVRQAFPWGPRRAARDLLPRVHARRVPLLVLGPDRPRG